MPVRPDQIDPTVQQALHERLTQVFSQAGATDPMSARLRSAGNAAWKQAAGRYRAWLWSGVVSLTSGLMMMPVLGGLNEGLAATGALLTVGLGVTLVVCGFQFTQQDLTRHVSPDVMRAAGKLVALTPAEELYCRTVAALIDAGGAVGEEAQQELLKHLNQLLASHRRLDRPIQQYQASAGGPALAALEEELAELRQRRDSQQDPLARATLEQSVHLCAERLEQARRLAPAREQAEAQRELIEQSLASVQSSLARMVAAPAVPAAAPAGHLDEVRRVVAEANSRARAVEDAVAEVGALGG